MDKQKFEFSALGGYAVLDWRDKKPPPPLSHVPLILCEKSEIGQPPASPDYDSFMRDNYNLLFCGDNVHVLSALLMNGFGGKVDLVYIDPPFDSGADYSRQVRLRGPTNQCDSSASSVFKQTQYKDVWLNDDYLQFMYERLILLRELLSDKGTIYLHCDWHKNHYLRLLLDEVFGENNMQNHIIWAYKTGGIPESCGFAKKHDDILVYTKTENPIFNVLEQKSYVPTLPEPHTDSGKKLNVLRDDVCDLCQNGAPGQKYRHVRARDVWDDINSIFRNDSQLTDYPTQKPESLLQRIIKASSDEDSIVLDCFCGSGTTAAVAEKLGRRWIVADINHGAIQTTVQRLNKITVARRTNNNRGFVYYRLKDFAVSSTPDVVIDMQMIKTDKTAAIKIGNYINPRLMARLQAATTDIFIKQIGDFRAQINYVLWDADYDGVCFNHNGGGDCPQKKTEFVGGEYIISLPHANATIAVKIVDMLGEETLIIK